MKTFTFFYKLFYDKYDKHSVFIEKVIEFYSIYDGFMFDIDISKEEDIFVSIYKNILLKYNKIKDIIDTQYTLKTEEKQLLERLAIGDRMAYTALKKEKISQVNGSIIYNRLLDLDLIEKEYSREKIEKKYKLTKKEFRGYQIQHKYKFKNSFIRFWFNFIEPNMEYLAKGEYHKVLEKIQKHFESFVSLTFEDLSNELVKKIFNNKIVEIGSYWDKKIEIDLLCKLSSDTIIAGECKWKNHKISKNILNSLVHKTIVSNLNANYFILFSKRGFSKELHNLNTQNIFLYDMKAFERLVHD